MVVLVYFLFEQLARQSNGNIGNLFLDILFGAAAAESRILFGTADYVICLFLRVGNDIFAAELRGFLGIADYTVCRVICRGKLRFPFGAAVFGIAFFAFAASSYCLSTAA